MNIYAPDSSSASGYGRQASACAKALGSRLSSSRTNCDFAICDPSDPVVSRFRFTMWEATELPQSCMAWKQSDIIITPCVESKKTFRRYTKKPIEVCNLYADGNYEHLPAARPFKFICIARDNGVPSRKGIDELITWFSEAFPTQSDVQLTIKQSEHCKRRYTFDKRVVFIHEDYERTAYHNLLASHHCGIFLSGAESWNLPACELMSVGRPSILVPFGGPADFTSKNTSWQLSYKMVKTPKEAYKCVGKIAYPDKCGTIRAMQEAYSDQLLLAEKALASAKASHEFTEARFAQRLRSIVNRYG